jgi:hypothetical protein
LQGEGQVNRAQPDAEAAALFKDRCLNDTILGLKKDPMIQTTSKPWMGGLWGREGVHPGLRS